MIEINLLPEELKVKVKTESKGKEFDLKKLFYLIPLVVGILLFVHLLLAVVAVVKGSRLKALEKQWKGMQSQAKQVEDFKQTKGSTAADAKAALEKRINWAIKMNKLSGYLPDGIWFNSMFINNKSLTLRCSVVSLQREEMSLITDFINRLKQDKDFFSGFSGLELSSVEKRTLGVYDIVDFSLTAIIKTAEPAVVAKPRPAATKK